MQHSASHNVFSTHISNVQPTCNHKHQHSCLYIELNIYVYLDLRLWNYQITFEDLLNLLVADAIYFTSYPTK